VFTVRDSALTLRVHWAGNNTVRRPTGSRWPVRTAAAGNARAVNVVRDGSGRPYIVSAADSGMLQTYTTVGRPALAARDTVRDQNSYDSVTVLLSSGNKRPDNAAPVNSLVNPGGIVLGSAVGSDSLLFALTPQGLRAVRLRADSLNAGWDTTQVLRTRGGNDTLFAFAGKAGPMVWGGRVFALDSLNTLRWWNADVSAMSGSGAGSKILSAGDWHALAGIVFGNASDSLQVIVAGRNGGTGIGAALRLNPATGDTVNLNLGWTSSFAHDSTEHFSATVSDFDRDGSDDVLLLGARGAAILAHIRTDKKGQPFPGWPQRVTRSAAITDSIGTYYTEDRSPPALVDLNADRRPDIVFSGTNGVFALDWRGAVIRGWPFRPQPRQSVGFGYGGRKQPESVIGSTPLAMTLRGATTVLVASPDGLIYAVDSNGRAVRYSSLLANPEATNGSGTLMSNQADWPLSVGGLNLDSNRVPFVHIALARLDTGTGDLSLIAQTATGSLSVWDLGFTRDALAGWLQPGGDAGRSQRLDLSKLALPAAEIDRETIDEFHLYPSPLRGGIAKMHLKIGAPATSVRLRVYDLSGRAIKDQTWALNAQGLQPVREFDLRDLGPDVYSVLCEVAFSGGKKTKWQRLGVVK
jgi:hypothetical protein